MKNKRHFLLVLLVMLISIMAFPMTASAAKKVKISKKSATVYLGCSTKLKLKNAKGKIKWSSSNPQVATVSKKGVVKAVAPGVCAVTAKFKKKKYTCRITVAYACAVDTSPINMKKGYKASVEVTLWPSGSLYWKTSNSDVAVGQWADDWSDSNHITLYIVAKDRGDAVITITNTVNGEVYQIPVHVTYEIKHDGAPHLEGHILSKGYTSTMCVEVTNTSDREIVIAGFSGIYYSGSGNSSSGASSIWREPHVYFEYSDPAKQMAEMMGEDITVQSGETVQFYLACKNYYYITDKSYVSFMFSFEDDEDGHMASIYKKGDPFVF